MSGTLSNVNIWGRILTDEEVHRMSKCFGKKFRIILTIFTFILVYVHYIELGDFVNVLTHNLETAADSNSSFIDQSGEGISVT